MFSYRMLKIAVWVMFFSVGVLCRDLLKKTESVESKTIMKYVRIVMILISVAWIVWLLFNKELFHWNYDIATGKPVDHYSTYGKCVIYGIIALGSNVMAHYTSRKKQEMSVG